MAGLRVPELAGTELSTPGSSDSNESTEPFFEPPRRKLRKLAHPPPSFHAFSTAFSTNQADLSFIVDEPPPSSHSNFPFIFPERVGRRSTGSDYATTFRSQSDSGHSYAYPLSSSSSPPLSMADSRTPLLRSLSALAIRKSIHPPTPPRKLTKPKPSVASQFKPLPIPEPESLPPLPPPPPPSKSLEQLSEPPKRRSSITFAFTVAIKRRFSMPKGKAKQELLAEEPPKPPHKSRSSSHVRSLTTPSSLTPSSSTKSKGKPVEKHLPFPPPPTPPAKDPASFLSPSRTSLPSPAISASTTSSAKLKKERKDKDKARKTKFTIGGDNDDAIEALPVPPPPVALSQASEHPPTEQVYDLNEDCDPVIVSADAPNDKVLPTPPRSRRPPLMRRNEGYSGVDGYTSENTIASSSSVSVKARSQRRWTLALAMTSDDLSDEVFVEKVERLRRDSIRVNGETDSPESKSRSVEGVGGFRGWEFGFLDPDSDDDWDGEEEGYEYDLEVFGPGYQAAERSMPNLPRSVSTQSSVNMGYPGSSGSGLKNSPNADPDKAWSSALHAMLITRDLLRTEKNYLRQLRVLLSSSPCVMTPTAQAIAETSFLWGVPGDSFISSSGVASTTGLLNLASVNTGKKSTSSALPWPKYPPPSLMHTYLLSLIALSISLLSEWEKDPTMAGAGRVLVEKEEEIERVFVGWCGVVGGWFAQDENGSGKKGGGGGVKRPMEDSESRRSRKLSKTKMSSTTLSSRSSLIYPPPPPLPQLASSATVSTASASTFSPTPPTVLLPSTSAVNIPKSTQTMSRRSTMSIAMAKWRKSMPNVQTLVDFTSNTELPSSSSPPVRSLFSSPRSAGPRVGSFEEQRTSQRRGFGEREKPQVPSDSQLTTAELQLSAKARRASMFLNLDNLGKDQEYRQGERKEEEEKENNMSSYDQGKVSRRRSYGVLPLPGVNWSEKGKSSSMRLTGGSGSQLPGASGPGFIDNRGRRIHSVRELGILPVQRVTRYALLFRDLLKYTPATSPSRPVLEQASEAAARIAAKCDRAQGNAEFFFGAPGW
ncbi:hypothetical protein FB446DRAFT_736602 [Lentinula raphanica]|nr:hypothetical protein FB446DRAFT_736602 [Lentinula raphanica]